MRDLRKIFPRASETFIKLNKPDPDGVPQGPDPKRSVQNEPLGPAQGAKAHPRKYVVRITSYRVVLADADALCGKYFVDALRRAKIIFDDTTEFLEYPQIVQKKVETKAQEKTLVEVELLPGG